MNQKIHEWLDDHELIKFAFVMLLALGLNLFTTTWMIKHMPYVTVAYFVMVGWFMFTRIVYLHKGGAL